MTESPFHDPQSNPLPDANDIEQANKGIELYSLEKVEKPTPSPQIKEDIKKLRNAFVWLIVIGAVIGCVMAFGASILLERAGLLDVPVQNQNNIQNDRIQNDSQEVVPDADL